MKKYISRLLLCASLAVASTAVWATPVEASPAEVSAEVQNDVKIAVKGNTLRVTGAAGLTLEIFSVTGQKVKAVKLSANDETVSTSLPRGCYIIKVGDVVRKVSLG